MTQEIDELLRQVQQCGDPLIFLQAMRLYARDRRHDDILRIAQEYFNDEHVAGMAYACHAGAWLLKTGDLDLCAGLFHRAAQLPGIGARRQVAAMVTSPKAFYQFGELKADAGSNPVTFMTVPAASPRFVMCATADEKYYRIFGDMFRDGFMKFNHDTDVILHFHLFDPGEELLATVLSHNSDAWSGRVCFSYEQTGGTNRSYYYAGRFIQMPRLLAHYRCPIAVSDIDTVFMGDLGELMDITSHVDIGVLELKFQRYLPWERFMAGLAVFNPTAEGAFFANALANFLVQAPKSHIDYWWVDQLGLAECAYMNRNLGVGSVAAITRAREKMCFQKMRNVGRPEGKARRARQIIRRREERGGDELDT